MQADREREALYLRLRSIESDLSSALAATSGVENRFAALTANFSVGLSGAFFSKAPTLWARVAAEQPRLTFL